MSVQARMHIRSLARCAPWPGVAALILNAHLALAGQPPGSASAGAPETVVVVGTSALPGTGIDPNKLPMATQTLSADDLERAGGASAAAALNASVGDVNINDNLDDPFQPDFQYRGFEASPVLGTPAGLAVYQNGVRINEAFGDTLNWDLVPDFAVDRIDMVSANPVYGLNALGGAVIVTMKNGFTADGAQAEASGGSFGLRQGSLQYGGNDGTFGVYAGARALNQDGWRRRSPDALRQFYSALSYRGRRLALDLSYTAVDNTLSGESSAPVQELAVGRSLIFTSPQRNADRLQFVALNANYAASSTLSLQGIAYYRAFHQSVVNGNTANYTACNSAPFAGYLCQGDAATPVFDRYGALIPDLSHGGALPLGERDFEAIRTASKGGTIQLTDTAAVLGHGNHLTIGAAIDSDSTAFASSAEVGTVDAALVVGASGYVVATPEGTAFTATPVGVEATNTYYGVYLTDTFDLTPELSLTASGRYNLAEINLADRHGAALNGHSRYSRFNPAIGFSDRLTPMLTAFAGYAEGNRAPTPAEIECSDPAAPCLLPSGLSSDPPNLRQVVSQTYEAGLRGQLNAPLRLGGRLLWNLNLFRTDVDHDIYAVATSLSSGYFQNIAGTRRQGVDLGLAYRAGSLNVSFNYSYVAATFQARFLLPSPLNPAADGNGNIQVRSGDTLPGIPAHRLKLGIDVALTSRWIVGGTALYESAQYFRGDEANRMNPLPGFAVLNLHSSYQVTEAASLFLNVFNVTDAQYATFGVLGDPTGVGAPGIPLHAGPNGPAVDYRFESPAAPVSVSAGIRLRFG